MLKGQMIVLDPIRVNAKYFCLATRISSENEHRLSKKAAQAIWPAPLGL